MEFRSVRALRGPNIWALSPVLELTVASQSLSHTPLRPLLHHFTQLPHVFTGLAARGGEASLTEASTERAHSIVGEPPLTWGRLIELMLLDIFNYCGSPSHISGTHATAEADVEKVIIGFVEEESARKAADVVRRMCEALVQTGSIAAFAEELHDVKSFDENVRLGPSTGSIVRAAAARGIPTRRLNDGSLVQLGYGSKQRRILAAETDRTSAIAESIAQDKELTKTLLRSAGVPVPYGRAVENAEDAWEAAEDIGVPVVVKPQYGNQGRGVAVNLFTKEQVFAAYEAAREEGSSILVEKFAPGMDHRLLVIGDRIIAAARREPPQVTGDGVSTIEQLVAVANLDPRRGEDHATCLSKLRLDAIGIAVLAEQNLTPQSVLPAGVTAPIRRNANLSTGGSAADVTDRVHPEVAARAIEAARCVGLDIAGVDVVCVDVCRPLEEQGGVIVEVNAAPGLRMHLHPSSGSPRNVGDAIVSLMFGEGDTGRIPIVAVTGVNGKTTTTRLVAHMLRCSAKRVGLTCTDGVYINDRRIDTGDCSGPKSARSVLLNPMVDAAVLETARGGVLREGLGFDRCDVAIVTNIGEGDHLGLGGINTLEELARVKRVIVDAVANDGSAVLNASDPLTAAMASHCKGSVIYFSRQADHPVMVSHRSRGGRVVFVRDGFIFTAEGEHEVRLSALLTVPLTMGGKVAFQIENVLAAVAAGWKLGLPFEVIKIALETFVNDGQTAPARFNVHEAGGVTIIVDYGHNASALLALAEAINDFPCERRSIVYTAAGDRRDCDILRQSEIISQHFDTLYLYEDACLRGRENGEVIKLMKQGLLSNARLSDMREMTTGEFETITTALNNLSQGDLIIVQADQVDAAVAHVQKWFDANRERLERQYVPATPVTAPRAGLATSVLQ